MYRDLDKKRESGRKYMAKWRAENPEKAKARAHEHYHKKIEEAKITRIIPLGPWNSAKIGAAKRGLSWNIQRQDFIIPSFCPVIGIPLDWSSYDNTSSLDRVDNNKGYEPENVIIVSRRVNRIKSAATIAELKMIGDYYGTK